MACYRVTFTLHLPIAPDVCLVVADMVGVDFDIQFDVCVVGFGVRL
jgi:hypothetical protein